MARLYYPQARVVLQVIFDGFGVSAKDSETFVIPLLPHAVTVHKNSYKQADSWEIQFDASDLPIDPDLIRAGVAEIFLFQVPGITDDERLLNRQLTLLQDPAEQKNVRDPIDALALELGVPNSKDKFTFGNKPIVAGLFDENSLEMDPSGRIVSIQGQDFTAQLMARQWPPTAKGRARRIPVGRKLNVIMAELLAEADPTGSMILELRGVDASDMPVVGKNEVRCHKRGIPVEQKTSYWDVLYKLAIRHGFITFVDGLSVVLTVPKGGTGKQDVKSRKFAWGNNLETLQLRRHLGKEKVPRIVVQGYDDTGKKGYTVQFPPAGEEEVPVGTLGVKEKEFQFVPAFGINDRAVLARIAESNFHLLGRGERKVTLTTKDLKDMAEDDLLNLTAGDALQVKFEPFNVDMLEDPNMSVGTKRNELVRRGYGEAIATVVAENYQKLEGLRRPLRVREVSYDYSVDSGISIEVEAVDFVVLAGQRQNPAPPVQFNQESKAALRRLQGILAPTGS